MGGVVDFVANGMLGSHLAASLENHCGARLIQPRSGIITYSIVGLPSAQVHSDQHLGGFSNNAGYYEYRASESQVDKYYLNCQAITRNMQSF